MSQQGEVRSDSTSKQCAPATNNELGGSDQQTRSEYQQLATSDERQTTMGRPLAPMTDYLPVTDQQRRSKMHHATPSIFPRIPKDPNARDALQRNLGRIGLGTRLLNFPWAITNADMVNELTGNQRVPEEVRHLECRAALHRLNLRTVEEIYDTRNEGEERPADSCKEHLRHFKEQREGADGYQIDWCSDREIRDILRFICPILDPIRPGQVHVFRFNQVYLALRRNVKVNWTRNIFRSMTTCAQQVGVSTNSYLSPFLFHF